MDEFFALLIKIFGSMALAGVTALLCYVTYEVYSSDFVYVVLKFVEAYIDSNDLQLIDKTVVQLVDAAEQKFKNGTLKADERLSFVQECLTKIGIEITSIIEAKIEAAVFNINKLDK